MTAVFSHSRCLDHDPGPGHVETPRRLRAVLDRIAEDGRFPVTQAEPAARELLLRVHEASYLDGLARVAAEGGGVLDPDTTMNAASWDAALGGAGAAVTAVRHALSGRGNSFAAVRPPGHHALADRAMGFCLLGNAVIAAREAQALGAARVLIVDWDVHHGNGTQALVERDPAIRFVSLHQWPHWPGTGAADETGVGNIFNVPRPGGLPPGHYVRDLDEAVSAAVRNWRPELLILSAGFDSMRGDPLGDLTLEPEHYAGLVAGWRERLPAVPIAGLLEGGYAPERIAEGVLATLGALI